MKTLSEVLENTLATAKQTTNLPAEQRYSLTKKDGNAIMEQLLTGTPEQNTESLVQYLKHTLKLPVNTSKRTIFTDHGCEFVDEVEFGEMTPEQREQARQAVNFYFTPLPSMEIIKLIARLQIIAPEREKTAVDLKARTSIWVEELSKYPADIVTMAMKKKYRWFPSLAEVLDYCDNEVARRKLIKLKLI